MRHQLAPPALALLVLAAAAPLAADTVRLRNGRSYEGVIAERTGEGVRIRLAFGVLVMPHDQVVAIEKGASPLAEYLDRKAALAADPKTSAADWLALARWAKANDLAQGVREAAVLAAELDPHLPGLDPLLRPFGLVLDETAQRWLPFEEAMARRGLVPFEGGWITAAEYRARLAERERERAVAAQEATARRLAAVADALRLREEREVRREAAEAAAAAAGWYQPLVVGLPWFGPGLVVVPPHGHHHRGHGGKGHEGRDGSVHPGDRPSPHAPAPRHGYGTLLGRVPGSLLPGAPLPDIHRPSNPAPAVSSASSRADGG
jgi:hypothetical protein